MAHGAMTAGNYIELQTQMRTGSYLTHCLNGSHKHETDRHKGGIWIEIDSNFADPTA